MVREGRLELPRRKTLEPKSSASTNSATPAKEMAGIPGFEPGNGGIKTRCLTAWRYPNRNNCLLRMVREGRLELPRRKTLEPKSSASTNSATPALMVATAGLEPATPSL